MRLPVNNRKPSKEKAATYTVLSNAEGVVVYVYDGKPEKSSLERDVRGARAYGWWTYDIFKHEIVSTNRPHVGGSISMKGNPLPICNQISFPLHSSDF